MSATCNGLPGRLGIWLLAAAGALSCRSLPASQLAGDAARAGGGGVARFRFDSGPRYLVVEVLKDDLAHFELSERHDGPSPELGIYTTPMVAKTDYAGPSSLSRSGNSIETPALRLVVDPATLCVTATDLARGTRLAQVCGEALDQETKRLAINPFGMTDAYGVGNIFYDPATADGNWVDRDWYGVKQNGQRTDMGNVRADFNGAAPSMSQFPVVYGLGAGLTNVALFLDDPYRISWNFHDHARWFAETWGDQLRFYLMSGPDLKALRGSYLALVGHPLIPPRALFGLWVSRFGYESWDDLHEDLASLRQADFPIEGFGLDLQWFGAGFGDPGRFKMGALRFDPDSFAGAAAEVRRLRDQEGVRLMNIEESYVNQALPEYAALVQASTDADCLFVRHDPARCTPSSFGSQQSPIWWGWGGMLDWTNPRTGDYWHHAKRLPLAKLGVTAHWTDLGEPEMYDAGGYYHGLAGLAVKNRHGDVHNLYNFLWLASIYRGYMDSANQAELKTALGLADPPRFFAMSRAGAPGLARFGAGMWSGDIGRNMGSLRAHLNTQMHMSLAGVDYYTSDSGGFTWALNDFYNDAKTDDQYRELYTQWFADSCLADIPVRPHGWAIGAQKTSYAPTNKGFKDSNYANIVQRYELAPYLYTMAWRAYQTGEPIVPPLVYHFQDDQNARKLGNVKMLGDALLFGVAAGYGQTERRVYLPKGRWVNYHTHESFDSAGAETAPFPLYLKRYGIAGTFTLPLFARAGAIIPRMFVDQDTQNIYGKRRDGARRDDLMVRVYADTGATDAVLYEDDGETLAYMQGQSRTTPLHQQLSGSVAAVDVGAPVGPYAGLPTARAALIELVVRDAKATGVTLNAVALPPCASRQEFLYGADACWMNGERNLVLARSRRAAPLAEAARFEAQLAPLPPVASVFFACDNGTTAPGESVYVVGPDLSGGWGADHAVKLDPTRYPRWTGLVQGLPAGTSVAWKCLKKRDGAASGTFENGANHSVTTPVAGGFAGTVSGAF